MKLRVVLPVMILAGVTVYLGDILSLRYRIPNREPYQSLEVRQLYAVKLKNKQTEFMLQPPEQQECVNSLFPHFGDPPCWYLRRNARQRVNIDSSQPRVFDR